MSPAEIKAALQLTLPPTRQAEIAKQCQVSAVTVHDVIHGRRRCKKVESALAAAVGAPLYIVFPQWYARGQPERVATSARKKRESKAKAALEDAIASLEQAFTDLGKCLSDHTHDSMPLPEAWTRLVKVEGIEFQLRNLTITQRGRLMRRFELENAGHG